MAAKMTTPEQARMFHMSQHGQPQCFDGCCLHAAIGRKELVERERNALRLALRGDGWSDEQIDAWLDEYLNYGEAATQAEQEGAPR